MHQAYPLHAQPGGWLQVLVFGMHVSPQAFPLVQTLQQLDPEGLPHAVASDGPLPAARVRANAAARRILLHTDRRLVTAVGTPGAQPCPWLWPPRWSATACCSGRPRRHTPAALCGPPSAQASRADAHSVA